MDIYHIISIFLNYRLAILKATKKRCPSRDEQIVRISWGKRKLIRTETNLSRFKVEVKDVSKVDKEAIQKLGAKGIVEIDNQLKIILGSESKQLKKYIDDLKS